MMTAMTATQGFEWRGGVSVRVGDGDGQGQLFAHTPGAAAGRVLRQERSEVGNEGVGERDDLLYCFCGFGVGKG